MLIFGLVGGLLGRRGVWLSVPAVLLWPVVLVSADVGSGPGFLVNALGLAVLNVGVGFLAGLAARRVWRRAPETGGRKASPPA